MFFEAFYLPFNFLLQIRKLWTNNEKKNWIALTGQATLSFSRNQWNIMIDDLSEVFRHLSETDVYHPFFNLTNPENQFTPLLILYQFSKKRVSLNYSTLIGTHEFFLTNFSSSFLRYIFNDQRISFEMLSLTDKTNIQLLTYARQGNFDCFIQLFKSFKERTIFGIFVGVLNFQSQSELYQIIILSSKSEIYFLTELLHDDEQLLTEIQKIRESRFLQVKKLLDFGMIEAALSSSICEKQASTSTSATDYFLMETEFASPVSPSPTISDLNQPDSVYSPSEHVIENNDVEFLDF